MYHIIMLPGWQESPESVEALIQARKNDAKVYMWPDVPAMSPEAQKSGPVKPTWWNRLARQLGR